MTYDFARIWAIGETLIVTALGRTLGIGVVVRYLRNPNPRVTVRLLRTFGATVGDRTTFKRGVRLDNVYEDANSTGDLSNLTVGSGCYIGEDVYLDLSNRVTIGDQAVLSGQVAVITHADCNRSPRVAAAFPRRCAPVTIGRGAWLAFRATILAGVTIGEDAVVAAHALVREDALPAVVHGGVPAKPIRGVDGQALLDPTVLWLPRRRRQEAAE